jgi:hypothetical protein
LDAFEAEDRKLTPRPPRHYGVMYCV